MPLPIQQVVTFAGTPFHGSPAFVLSLDHPRPVALLQEVCRELRDFVLAVLSVDGDDIDLRFVTPHGIHAGPGHATHAAAFVALKRLKPGSSLDLRIEGGGRRRARIEDGLVAVDWPAMPLSSIDQVAELARCLGRTPLETFQSTFGLIAVFSDDAEIAALRPDFAQLALLAADTVMVTSPATGADFAIRVFAPKIGLPEDPVCGTAHRILVPYWADRFGRSGLVSHQLSARGGVLHCRIVGDIVTIAGEAVSFLDGVIDLSD
ncbi:MAG: PhzF family phenazine biosynthesis protein [Devosia sp.]